jgi:hypothetical protein
MPFTVICSHPSQQAVQGWHSRGADRLAKVFPVQVGADGAI